MADEPKGEPGDDMAKRFLEEFLNDDARFAYRAARLLESGTTEYQSYEVWETPQFGRLFRLDGCFMTSERDEFFYHENLIHVAGSAHLGLRDALIIGGGDGGSAEELFKYPGIERVVLVELDAKVVDIARKHLPAVHRGSLDDPRLELRIEDGLAYVAEKSTGAFDLIVLDLTDPVGPAESLYTEAFFAACKRLLRAGGALTLHLGSPVFQPSRVRDLVERLRLVFRHVAPYFMYIPLYGSQWGMAVASDTLDPRGLAEDDVDAVLRQRGITGLQYYNGAMHRAQFALPNYLRSLLA